MEYNVKIDKVDTQNMSYDSSAECLEITLEEYKHVTERANKYDNKIYIIIKFCNVFFVFIFIHPFCVRTSLVFRSQLYKNTLISNICKLNIKTFLNSINVLKILKKHPEA